MLIIHKEKLCHGGDMLHPVNERILFKVADMQTNATVFVMRASHIS